MYIYISLQGVTEQLKSRLFFFCFLMEGSGCWSPKSYGSYRSGSGALFDRQYTNTEILEKMYIAKLLFVASSAVCTVLYFFTFFPAFAPSSILFKSSSSSALEIPLCWRMLGSDQGFGQCGGSAVLSRSGSALNLVGWIQIRIQERKTDPKMF